METGDTFLRVSGTFLLLIVVLGLGAAQVWAQTTINANWTDATGNWTTPSNWSCNCIPNNSPANVFNVTIPTGDVSLDNTSSLASATINALSLGSNLEINDGESLSVTGNVDATHGSLNVASYPGLSVGGDLTANGVGVQLGAPNYCAAFPYGCVPSTYVTAGNVSVAGAFIGSATLNPYSTLQASSFTNTGHLYNFGGTTAVSGDFTNGPGDDVELMATDIPVGSTSSLGVGANLTNSGVIDLVPGDHELGSVLYIGGNLTNTRTGDLEIQANSSVYLGGNTSNFGTINLTGEGDHASDLSTANFSNSGTVNIGNGQFSPGFPGPSLFVYTGGTYTQTAGLTDVAWMLVAPSVIIKGGTLAVESGASLMVEPPGGAYTQTAGSTDVRGTLIALSVNIKGGTLSVESGASLMVSPGGSTYRQTAGSTEVDGTLMAPTVVISGGTLSDIGTVTVNAGGTYTQTAGSTEVYGTLMAPTVKISGGTLSGAGTIQGNVTDDAVLAPGDPATLTIDGNYTQNADGTLVIDIASATDFSMLDITGAASLDGTVDFDFLNGFVPGPHTDFAFLTAGSVAGDFSSLDFTGIKCSSCTFNLNTLSLDIGSTPPSSATPEPGTLALFGTGLLALATLPRKKQWRLVRDQ